MIVIAESGSTKCDWLILNDEWNIITHLKTIGYNPYFHDEYFISGDLKLNPFLSKHKDDIKRIFFYGAGCSSPYFCNIVQKGLTRLFEAAEIAVEHDLMGSALAAYKGEPMISCILGTGSNSCYFNGKEVKSGNPPLGFIVGDEASGCYFGKRLLNAYFNKKLPEDLRKSFEKSYGLTHAEFTSKTYGSDRGNVYLASFMKFYSDERDHAYIQQELRQGFQEFIEKHIACFDNYQKMKVNFVGSIAFFFQEEIELAGKDYNIDFGEFNQNPVFKLAEYHQAQEALIAK